MNAVIEVLRLLFSTDPKERERGADEVTDILGSFGDWEVELVSRALVSMWTVEPSVAVQEAALHALSELSNRRGLPADVRVRLLAIDPDGFPQSHREYLDGIRGDA